ncbi:hypothetical protein HPB49_015508 [Dermacentor silvarum]|uniref:Uncharacterized protein n=1 Tax=Dermacentor silvarum TaxID=543639 RepID=A0ACB8D689_DERSI|nr:hypothetical protein HPB49_015508 [Dermacentor silvarum]
MDKPLERNAALCELHFDPQFVSRHFEHIFSGELVRLERSRPLLQPDAILTIFPNVPKYISKPVPKKSNPKEMLDPQFAPPQKRNSESTWPHPTHRMKHPRLSPTLDYQNVIVPSNQWEDFHRMNDYIDLEDIEEVDEDALSETERENDGTDVPLAPSCVKASNITSTTATISWLPSNSNFSHVVAVNSVEMKSLKPGTFRHLVTGLAPNTSYRVSVRAKPGRLLMSSAAAALTGASASADEHAKGAEPRKLASMLTSFVDFRTLPKGIPDPPVDVQVEAGPQEGTVLVTWLPVTINALGTSNGAAVTGYAVYAAGKKVTEIDSPTGDHALLEVTSLLPLHTRAITVRTRAGDSLSVDSLPVVVPDELVHPTRTSKNSDGSDSESETETAALLRRVKRRARAFDAQQKQSAERVEENHSELSDIVEELEDEMMENGEMHQMHQPGGHQQYQQSGNMHQPPPQQPPVAQRRQGPAMAQQPMHQGVGGGVHHHGVRRSEKRNSAGQLIIEPEDALSDKEIYPYYGPSGMPMDMAKDNEGGGLGVVDNYSEEEFAKYDMGPRGGAPRPAARHQVPGRYHGGGGGVGGPRGGVDQHWWRHGVSRTT